MRKEDSVWVCTHMMYFQEGKTEIFDTHRRVIIQQKQQSAKTTHQQIILPFVPGLSPTLRRILNKAGHFYARSQSTKHNLVACRKARKALSRHCLVPSLRTAWDIFSEFEPCFFITHSKIRGRLAFWSLEKNDFLIFFEVFDSCSIKMI